MKITQSAGEYQLADNQEVEITENNPLLTDVGSKSLPITLPPSEHNFALLGNPQRIARKSKYPTRHRFVITQGVLRKTGTHVIFSASKQAGIQTTFYLKEGEFYTKIKNITMPELDFGGEQNPFTGTSEQKINSWIKLFEQVMLSNSIKDFCVFTVITKYEDAKDEQGGRNGSGDPVTELLNEPTKEGKLVSKTTFGDTDVPYGYGITCFLRLSYVLDKLFENFGYKLKPTLWHTDADFKKTVLLNNNADAIVTGTLNFADLVPTVEVDKFLDCICKKFNCSFDIQEDKNTVEFYFLDNVLEKQAQKDLTPFLDGDIEEVVFNEFKQVKLSAGIALQFANTDTITYKDFAKKYPKIIEVTESEYSAAPPSIDTVYFRKSLGAYYKKVSENNKIKHKRISSCFFTLNNADGDNVQSFDSGDEQSPVLYTRISNSLIRCPFVGDRRHVSTALKVDGVLQDEEKQNMPIMLCFSIGKADYKYTSRGEEFTESFYMGTPFEYNHKGELWGKASLRYHGEHGLFNRFFKRTDAALRNSFSPVTCKLQMPITELLKLRFTELYLLQGQPVILYSNQYSIGNNQVKFNKTEFRTTRLLEPVSLYIDETLPQIIDPSQAVYYWEQKSNIEELKAKHGGVHISHWLFEIFTPAALPQAPTKTEFEQGGKFHKYTTDIKLYAQKIVQYRPLVGVIYTDKLQIWFEPRQFADMNRVVFYWKECDNRYEIAAKEFKSNLISSGQREYQDKNNIPPSVTELDAVNLNNFLTGTKIAQAQYPIYIYRTSVQSGGIHSFKQKDTLTVWFEPSFKII